jgi:peptidoglycan/xylan/chitin deacetylase (PgdA/CDA1 family)
MRQRPSPPGKRKSLARRVQEAAFRAGIFDAYHALRPRRLTVLSYHRVDDPYRAGFDTFRPNVSATIAGFAAQLDYVLERFNVVSNAEVVAWLSVKGDLPDYALLITFDDGYSDNLRNAAPILKARQLPALIFLTTDYIGQARPFYWDLVAYCFARTERDMADLPLLGRRSWPGAEARAAVVRAYCERLKLISEADKLIQVEQLPEILDVSIPSDAFAGLTLTWEQVRELAVAGIDVGSHTMSHPILTRIPIEQAREELAGSRARIEAQGGRPVVSLAYPNGLATDFSPQIEALARDAGYLAAFTLLPGPSSYAHVRRAPMQIRRIFIGHKDTLPRFAAKVSGVGRLAGWG